MDQLQHAAHLLRSLASTTPETPPSIVEQTESIRSLRGIVESVGALVGTIAERAGSETTDVDGYVSRVKNPVHAHTQLAAARLVLTTASERIRDAASFISAGEIALARLTPAPPTAMDDSTEDPDD
jgi:hypothetical protein